MWVTAEYLLNQSFFLYFAVVKEMRPREADGPCLSKILDKMAVILTDIMQIEARLKKKDAANTGSVGPFNSYTMIA